MMVKPENLCRPSCGRSALKIEIDILTSGVASSGRVRANRATWAEMDAIAPRRPR